MTTVNFCCRTTFTMLTSNYYDRFSSGNGGIDSGDWKRNKPSFDLAESVRKLDEQLARVRTSPSKVATVHPSFLLSSGPSNLNIKPLQLFINFIYQTFCILSNLHQSTSKLVASLMRRIFRAIILQKNIH